MTAAIALALAPVALLFAVYLPVALIRAIVEKKNKDGVDWSNDCPGIDLLGDGGRRLD